MVALHMGQHASEATCRLTWPATVTKHWRVWGSQLYVPVVSQALSVTQHRLEDGVSGTPSPLVSAVHMDTCTLQKYMNVGSHAGQHAAGATSSGTPSPLLSHRHFRCFASNSYVRSPLQSPEEVDVVVLVTVVDVEVGGPQ